MSYKNQIVLRPATLADLPQLAAWDSDLVVISATSDDPDAKTAFEGIGWAEEIENQNEHSSYHIAEFKGRPIGAMQIIDPHLEHTHYWGQIEPNLRAIDIWIGTSSDRGKGYGTAMMTLAISQCFTEAKVTAIVIDPLASNTRALVFYKRLDFQLERRRMFGNDDCLVHRLTRDAWERRAVNFIPPRA